MEKPLLLRLHLLHPLLLWCVTVTICEIRHSISVYTNSIFVYFQLNLGILPKCEQYYRQQGYDFKFADGRVVLVRRTRRRARQRRQGQVGSLIHFLFYLVLTNEGIPV